MKEIEFEADGRNAKWWGHDDFYCDTSNIGPRVLLPYQGEPAHGDSFHRLIIDSKTIRGYVWSGYFLWSKTRRFFTCDWLEGMGGVMNGALRVVLGRGCQLVFRGGLGFSRTSSGLQLLLSRASFGIACC